MDGLLFPCPKSTELAGVKYDWKVMSSKQSPFLYDMLFQPKNTTGICYPSVTNPL